MTLEPRAYNTTIATFLRAKPDELEIRYKPGSTLTLEGMAEVQAMRREIMGHARYGMITIIPDDVDFQLNTMHMDHLAVDRALANVIATVVVAQGNMIEMMVKLYFSYYPQMHRVLVTDDEAEARSWLAAQLAEAGATGS